MAHETVSPPEGQIVTGLVSGIIGDAQELVKQQVALARAEIKADFQRTVRAAVLLSAGAVVLVPALFLVCNMFVYMLNELAACPSGPATASSGRRSPPSARS